jgi:phosphohistidine phosphatase SixA
MYEATPATLLVLCRQGLGETRLLMLVGHNPGLAVLCERLNAQPLALSSNGKLLPTAAFAVLPLLTQWAQLGLGASEGTHIVRSRELPTNT